HRVRRPLRDSERGRGGPLRAVRAERPRRRVYRLLHGGNRAPRLPLPTVRGPGRRNHRPTRRDPQPADRGRPRRTRLLDPRRDREGDQAAHRDAKDRRAAARRDVRRDERRGRDGRRAREGIPRRRGAPPERPEPGLQPVTLADLPPSERDAAWASAEVLVCTGFGSELPRDLASRAPRLRMIQALLAGVDNLPFDRFPRTAIVCSNAGAYTTSVAEH